MSAEMIRGGVLLIGSLEWENADNEDGRSGPGKVREDWRNRWLGKSKIEVSGLPIRYARISGKTSEQVKKEIREGVRKEASGAKSGLGRRGQYTMCLTKDVAPVGQALFRPFRESVSGCHRLVKAAEALADAEGIPRLEGLNVARTEPPWGIVAIWFNPASTHRDTLADWWSQYFGRLKHEGLEKLFPGVVDDKGVIILPWPEGDLLDGVDFCLCTPTVPTEGVWGAVNVAEAAKAAFENGKGRYFRFTYCCGIRTADDDAIINALKAFDADQEIMPSLDGGLSSGPQG